MLKAYLAAGDGLTPLPSDGDLGASIWIDLLQPLDTQVRQVNALGYDVPTLADMEEIEISNRLYTDKGTLYMTAVLPGILPDGTAASMPVTFILNQTRLVTVRHHTPRPFDTFPARAERSSSGCGTSERVFLGLLEEIVGRLADLSEGVSGIIDRTVTEVLSRNRINKGETLETALVTIAQQAELLSRNRLALLSLDRLLTYHASNGGLHSDIRDSHEVVGALQKDIQSLEVHCDFLTSRINMAVDATMGMISLQQNDQVKLLSVVAALFLPPTLIASIFGMNFKVMPSLGWMFGFPMSLVLMAGSVFLTVIVLKWKRWF